MAINEIIAYIAIGSIGLSVAFIFFMEVGIKKMKAVIKILKYGKAAEKGKGEKAKETKKVGDINSRGRW